MGDVLGITEANGNLIAQYLYDEWGKLLSIDTADEDGSTAYREIAEANPLRYRGYYYDNETGYYYLQSRYYDPEICRFINADEADVLAIYQSSPFQYNLFIYCYNNSVNMVDHKGDIPQWIITGVIHLAITGTRSWVWYNTAKSAIFVAGNAYLAKKGYELSRRMFNHGMWQYGKALPSSTNRLIVDRLCSSSNMRNAISKIMKKAKGNKINKSDTVEFDRSNRVNADLYFSLQHIKFNIKGNKSKGKWNLTITVTDVYNFDNLRSLEKFSFGNAANDLGWAMQRIGMMVPYNIYVSYKIRW